MADGYARATGRPGVVLVTSGPGATNTVTGLLTALMDSSPMIVISGPDDHARMLGKDAFQEADVTGITYPGREAQLPRQGRARHPAHRARGLPHRDHRPPGPGADRRAEGREFRALRRAVRRRASICPATPCRAARDPARAVEAAARCCTGRERPLLYVGHGAVISGAGKAVTQLAEKLRAPIVNTLLGKGAADETHPLHLGMLGMHGTAYANKAVVDCDLIMAIGARWDDRITGKVDEFCTDAVKIHIDIDPAEFNKMIRPDVSLVGDARLVIEDLLPLVETARHRARG